MLNGYFHKSPSIRQRGSADKFAVWWRLANPDMGSFFSSLQGSEEVVRLKAVGSRTISMREHTNPKVDKRMIKWRKRLQIDWGAKCSRKTTQVKKRIGGLLATGCIGLHTQRQPPSGRPIFISIFDSTSWQDAHNVVDSGRRVAK